MVLRSDVQSDQKSRDHVVSGDDTDQFNGLSVAQCLRESVNQHMRNGDLLGHGHGERYGILFQSIKKICVELRCADSAQGIDLSLSAASSEQLGGMMKKFLLGAVEHRNSADRNFPKFW